MPTKQRLYNSTMSSVQALENRCNFDELNIPGQLQSLEAALDSEGLKVTIAIYEKIPAPVGVGNLKIDADETGNHSAWIMAVNTNVLVSR